MLTALNLLCSIGTTDCKWMAEAQDHTELPFMCLKDGQEEAAKHPVPDDRYVKVACVHKRVPRIYRVVSAWSCFLLFIGAGAFVVGMAIHNEATAKPPAPHPEPIYYCATSVETPSFEPCRDRKDQMDI